jgi:threonine dehydrogenase-like Zn-dependent dehydrogenase
MKALRWHGKKDIRCDNVPDPTIEHSRDAIIRVSTCAICGSDLHLFDGFMPGMESGDIMGHEFMGEVVEVGHDNTALEVGDRIVVPFTIICGECDQCKRGNFSVCERSNRNKDLADKTFGHATAGLFGYSHLTGGYPGGQAEYVRVPFADKTHVNVPAAHHMMVDHTRLTMQLKMATPRGVTVPKDNSDTAVLDSLKASKARNSTMRTSAR